MTYNFNDVINARGSQVGMLQKIYGQNNYLLWEKPTIPEDGYLCISTANGSTLSISLLSRLYYGPSNSLQLRVSCDYKYDENDTWKNRYINVNYNREPITANLTFNLPLIVDNVDSSKLYLRNFRISTVLYDYTVEPWSPRYNYITLGKYGNGNVFEYNLTGSKSALNWDTTYLTTKPSDVQGYVWEQYDDLIINDYSV